MNLLGHSKTQPNNGSVRATLPKDVVQLLQLTIGDVVVFCESDSGDVILRKNGKNGVHR